jgi:hypothetical protein
MKSGLVMALVKLFTEDGELDQGFEGIDTLQEESARKVSFTSEVKGEGNFPSGPNGGKGEITRHADGTFDASYDGELKTAKGVIKWKSYERSEEVERGKVTGLEEVTGFPQRIIMVTRMLSSKKFRNIGYELK